MRVFDYRNHYSIISTTIKGYINQLTNDIDNLYRLTNDKKYIDAFQIVEQFKQKYPNLGKVQDNILKDLLSPANVDYAFKNKFYPVDASNVGMEFEKDLKVILELEEKLKDIAITAWMQTTKFEDIVNGEDFMVVGHAARKVLKHDDIIDNEYSKLFISCSLFSNNELNTFMDYNIVTLVEVDTNNYICSSASDCVTSDSRYDDFKVLKDIIGKDGIVHHINVGYMNDTKKTTTSISTPHLIEKLSVEREHNATGEYYKYENCLTNEVVLDRTNTKEIGALLIGNGCDFLFNEYCILKQSGIPFKCINKGLYKEKKGLKTFSDKEFLEFKSKLDYYLSLNIDEELLQNYYDEVVLPMNYNEEILQIITSSLNIDTKKK